MSLSEASARSKSYRNSRSQEQHLGKQLPVNEEQEYENNNNGSIDERALPAWKVKEARKKLKKQIFGEHYNYDYKRPNQNKMYRMQESKNTEIERANRILLEKIQSIFKRSVGSKRQAQAVQKNSEAVFKSELGLGEAHTSHSHHDMNLHDFIVEQKISHRKKPRNQSATKIGALNNPVEMARNEIKRRENTHMSKVEGNLNRKVTKLAKLQDIAIQKRRVNTEISHQASYKGDLHESRTTKINNLANNVNKKLSQNLQRALKNAQQDTDPVVNGNQEPRKKKIEQASQAEEITGKVQLQKSIKKSARIILHRANHVRIGVKQYQMQMYVQNHSYIIEAISVREKGDQYKEIIAMPYRDYQELYKNCLGYSHEGIIELLEVEPKNGLLQIKGFDSQFMDIFEYGQCQVSPGLAATGNVVVHYSHRGGDIFDASQFASTSRGPAQVQGTRNREPISELLAANITPVTIKQSIPELPRTSKKSPIFSSGVFSLNITPANRAELTEINIQKALAKKQKSKKSKQKLDQQEQPQKNIGRQESETPSPLNLYNQEAQSKGNEMHVYN